MASLNDMIQKQRDYGMLGGYGRGDFGGGYTPSPSYSPSKSESTVIKYAVKATVGNKAFASKVAPSGHFTYAASTELDDATLFDSAAEAEKRTQTGRDCTKGQQWAVVPVKVTTTRITQTVVKETVEEKVNREIVS